MSDQGDLPTSPAFERNRDPIQGVLHLTFPKGASKHRTLLELASGPGQHVVYWAHRMPHLKFFPTEANEELLPAIDERVYRSGLSNIEAAQHLKVGESTWPDGPFDGALAVNYLHMVAEETVRETFLGLGRVLEKGAPFVVYDCFTFEGKHTAESNARFDLKLRDYTPGRVYAFEDVCQWAEEGGFAKDPVVHELPANNLGVVFTRTES
jgi:cyclopropane fatty-acyl-phospholipid synthase-like methyltransferase